MTISIPKWTIAEDIGYTPKTTFWLDFSIADCFGLSAVKDTFLRAFKEWKHDPIYLTELTLVMNHKLWMHYETNEKLAELYNELWRIVDNYALENLKGDDLRYFLSTVD